MSFLRRLPCSAATAGLLAVIAFFSLGSATRLFDLSGVLALSPVSVWHGQLWRPLSASFFANGLLDLVFSAVALFWVSSELERFWKPLEWLIYGVLCVVIAGLAASALFPRAELVPAGPSLWIVALLVARVRLAPHERIHLTPTLSISTALAALLWAAMIIVTAGVSGMPSAGLFALGASAAAGWLYLTVRWFLLKRKPARSVTNTRFGRLEL